jgi:hypothetical protein
MLRNWAIHARTIGMGYAVACMDEGLFDTASKQGIPAAIMKGTCLAIELTTCACADAAMLISRVRSYVGADAAAGAVTTRWKYYRMDPKAFLQMGILKVAGDGGDLSLPILPLPILIKIIPYLLPRMIYAIVRQ